MGYCILMKLDLNSCSDIKVDREKHFQRPGFLHIIIVFSKGTKPQISFKILDVTDV